MVSSEARTLESSSYMRKCVIIRSSDLTQTEYLKVQDSSPSAILILVNGNMSEAETEVCFVQLVLRRFMLVKKINSAHALPLPHAPKCSFYLPDFKLLGR